MSTPATPALVETKPAVVVTEVPESPNAETDKRVTEVLNEKKKKKHPVEARIAQLTAKASAIEEQAKKDKADLEAQLEKTKADAVAAEAKRQHEEAIKNSKRPARAEFPDGPAGDADFNQKMAEWVVYQQEKIVAKSPVTTTSTTPVDAPAIDPAAQARLKENFDGFLTAGKKFMERNPDFNEVLQKAQERGLNLDNRAMVAIISLRAPEVAYYLARPENDATARKFMAMDGAMQALEVARIAERLTVNPADFVSNAGNPGRRLNGSAHVDVRTEDMDTDDYLRKRKQDIKTGLRRR